MTDWDAESFFREKIAHNRLARKHNFQFCMVSGLHGFEDALAGAQRRRNFVALCETSDGTSTLDMSPRTRRVKTLFIAMPHKEGDMVARKRCFEVMHELYRQLLSALIREKTTLDRLHIFLHPEARFSEIAQYFFNGAACAHMSIVTEVHTDLIYRDDEWDE